MDKIIRIAVVDDETTFLTGVVPVIRQYFEKQGMHSEIVTFTSTGGLLEWGEGFDLLFLDIDMPGRNGIQLASELRENGRETTLLFVSAHDHFVFESIRYAPFRFIRKRFLQRELPEAITAYCRLLQHKQRQIPLLLERGEKMMPIARIVGFYTIRHDLFLLDSSADSILLQPRQYTLEQLEETLQPDGFLRVHKSYLLNYRFIYQVRQDKILLTLFSGQERLCIPMSRRRTQQIREAYHAWLEREAAHGDI